MNEICNLIDKTGPFLTFDLETNQREELMKTYTEFLTKEDVDGQIFVLGDYRDLCIMSLMMVGGQLPGN